MGPKRRHPIIIDYEGQRPPRKSANKRVTAPPAAFRLSTDNDSGLNRRRSVWLAASIVPVVAIAALWGSDEMPLKTDHVTVAAGTSDSIVASTVDGKPVGNVTETAEAAKPEPIDPIELAPHKAHHDKGAHTGHESKAEHLAEPSPPHQEPDIEPVPGPAPSVAAVPTPSPASAVIDTPVAIEPLESAADTNPATKNGRQRRVLIVGIDGFRADAFPYVFIPTLQGLRRKGASHMEGHTNQPTHSGPGWATLLTGQNVATHGVKDNRFKDLSTFQAQNTVFHDYKERYPYAHIAAFVGWRPIRTHLLKDVPLDVSDSGLDVDIARKAAKLLAEDPHLGMMFVHLDAVDQVGHKYGYHYRKKTYRGAITRADTRLGRILKALNERSDRDDWLIVVTTDHGGSLNGSHGQDRPANKRIFTIVAGAGYPGGSTLEKPPSLRDIAPTIRGFIGAPAASSPGVVMTAVRDEKATPAVGKQTASSTAASGATAASSSERAGP